MGFVCHEKQFPSGVLGVNPRGSLKKLLKSTRNMFKINQNIMDT